MIEETLTEAFASELEKLAFDPLSALAALGAVGGGVFGAADPARFDPGWVDKSLRGGTGVKGRLASGLLGAATIGSVLALPKILSAPFEDDDRRHMTRTASAGGVALATARGGRTAAKSSKIRKIFQPRAAAEKAWRDNMRSST